MEIVSTCLSDAPEINKTALVSVTGSASGLLVVKCFVCKGKVGSLQSHAAQNSQQGRRLKKKKQKNTTAKNKQTNKNILR